MFLRKGHWYLQEKSLVFADLCGAALFGVKLALKL